MSTSSTTGMRSFLKHRTAVVAAAVAGFLVGAAGFAAADGMNGGDDSTAPTSTAASTTTTVASTTTGAATTTDASTTTEASTTVAVTPTVVDVTISTLDDDTTSTTIVESSTSTTVDATTSTTIVESSTSATVDDTTSTTIDDDTTSTTVDDGDDPVAAFTKTYSSRGGSITVTWNGMSLSLDAVSPAPGYQAEIEDDGGDRVRVDFEGDDADARIEVRVHDGEVRERIDG